ncbi:MAG: ABC transporter ATP-binding protein [Chitinophagales bacterium]|nr:ABC transporter ATP-binding protein [Chitinophagaceae bacterium]MCB9065062.1 ABC transporter ATP-binding protein [Chitinophagales bacterium]
MKFERGTSAIAYTGKLYRLFNHKQKREFKGLIVLTFIASITDLVGLSLIIPVVGLVLSETFYDSITTQITILANFSKTELLLYTVAAFFFLIVAKNAFGLWINKLQVNFVRRLYVSSTMNVLDKVYDRTMLDMQKETSNELVSKLTYYQSALCSSAAISSLILINEAIIFILTGAIICWHDWKLFFLLIGVVLPIMGLFYLRVKNMIKVAGEEKSKNSIKLYAYAQEMIFGYTDIKIAGTEDSFKDRFNRFAKKYSFNQAQIDFMMFVPTRIIEIAIFLCIIIILIYGVFVLKDTEKIITTVSLFSMVAYRSIPSINRFVISMNNLTSTGFIFKDPDFLPTEEDEAQPEQAGEITLNKGIVFNDVMYSYPGAGANILKHCNLEIKKGESVGIIGRSGAGKSTLVNNLLGFLHPTGGDIHIDNTKLTIDNTHKWWEILGYVRQEVFVMNATFKENIAIGENIEDIDMAKLNRAIDLSSLKELVNSWPEKENTMLNERGNNLSGGQKQRISIARAIYKGAEILIFDEATSALDSKTEEEITNSIRALGEENLTTVIIAHRYTSLKYCDKIFKIDGGTITDTLSYNELMQKEQTSINQ